MKLYYHPASTTSRVVQQFALDQGIDLDYSVVDIFSGAHRQQDYLRINPNGLVPVLEDGDFQLTESSAILKYIAEKTGSPAYPTELKARARVNEMMDWFNANFYRDFGYGLIYAQVFPAQQRPDAAVQAGTLAWAKKQSQEWLKTLDQSLIGPDKSFLCGDRITLADYLGAEFLDIAGLIGGNFVAYPNIDRWMRNMKALKTWPQVHETIEGFAASLKGQVFQTF